MRIRVNPDRLLIVFQITFELNLYIFPIFSASGTAKLMEEKVDLAVGQTAGSDLIFAEVKRNLIATPTARDHSIMTTLTSRQLWQEAQELTFEEAYWYVYLPLDEHSLDPEDWWLMIGCCCKVASRLCMAVKQDDGRVRLLHTGQDVLSRMDKVYVETYLDSLDETFVKSFHDSKDFEAIVSQASKLTKCRGILAWD